MLTSSYDVYTGALRSVTFTHKTFRTTVNRRGALVCLGGGADVASIYGSATSGMDEYATARIPCIAGNLAANLWHFGNDTAISNVANLWSYATTSKGFRSDKYVITAGSMGALAALNYLISLANPAAECAAVLLAIPVLDLDSVYQGDLGGYRSEIETAYSVTHPTAIPDLATHSPVAYSAGNKAKLTMPVRIYASDNDTTASNTTACQTWAATLPNASVISLGAVGHTDPGNKHDRVAWLQTNL